jgi:hypothetical protein
LFLAEIVKQMRDKQAGLPTRGFTATEMASALFGVTLRAGTGLALVDEAMQALRNTGGGPEALKALDKLGRESGLLERATIPLQQLAGEVVAGTLTPLRQFNDFIGEFDRDYRIVRDTASEPFWGPIKEAIPGLTTTLPPKPSPTRPGPVERYHPGLKHGGFRMELDTPVEKELYRHHYRRTDLVHRTGNHAVNLLIADAMGPLVNDILKNVFASPAYTGANWETQQMIIEGQLNAIRQAAFAKAKMTVDNRTMLDLWLRKMAPGKEAVLRQELGKMGK